jgi:hypothetical protein
MMISFLRDGEDALCGLLRTFRNLRDRRAAIDPDDADHPTIHGLRGTGILARAE